MSKVVEQPRAAGSRTPTNGEPDTEERERRRRSVDSVDPPTEDTKLTELLDAAPAAAVVASYPAMSETTDQNAT